MMSDELAETLTQIGITYRQFDHWHRRGFLPSDNPTPGTGYHRELTPGQTEHLRIMGALVAAGLQPEAASRLASSLRSGYCPRLAGYRLVPLGAAA